MDFSIRLFHRKFDLAEQQKMHFGYKFSSLVDVVLVFKKVQEIGFFDDEEEKKKTLSAASSK